jgi:hypothetical protein
MKFQIGQEIIYTTLTGKKYKGTIIHRKCDFPEKYINTENEKSGFDYSIRIFRNEKDENIFVNEKDLI